MTFKLELTDNGIIKNSFESISRIVDEITLTPDSEGLHLRALDRSHITFVTLDLDKTVFDEYQCDTPEQIAIDCKEFMDILKKMKTTDILRLSVDEGSLIITFEGDATRKFKIRFIDMEYDNPVPPKLDLPCKINIPSNLLKDYINDMEIFSDKLTFMIDENYFFIKGEGQSGDAEIKYLHGENILQVVESSFSVPKLKDILKASKFTNSCYVSLGDTMPLIITFELPTNDGRLEYLLAPRVEQD